MLRRLEPLLVAVNGRLASIDNRMIVSDAAAGKTADRLTAIDSRLTAIDGRLTGIDGRLDTIDDRLKVVEAAFAKATDRFNSLDVTLAEMKGSLKEKLTWWQGLLGMAAIFGMTIALVKLMPQPVPTPATPPPSPPAEQHSGLTTPVPAPTPQPSETTPDVPMATAPGEPPHMAVVPPGGPVDPVEPRATGSARPD